MPNYCPKLNTLYDLILSVLLRVPIGIANHVYAKCLRRLKPGEDHTPFIAEIRPVLEELKVSLFCVETLDLEQTPSNIIKTILDQARREFTQLWVINETFFILST